jgi:hypothetical protein
MVRPTASRGPGGDITPRVPLGDGSHPEIELRAQQLRFVGRADLLTLDPGSCTITDFKTGTPNPHHADQLLTYAVLWHRDVELNPDGVPVGSLVLSYSEHDETVDPPDAAGLLDLEEVLARRISDAEIELQRRPPPARPAPTICQYCSVRHLCDDYWAGPASSAQSGPMSQLPPFLDVEAVVVSNNGPRSWMIEWQPSGRSGLLQTQSERVAFRQGDHIRILDVAVGSDEDGDVVTLTMTKASEVYLLDPR